MPEKSSGGGKANSGRKEGSSWRMSCSGLDMSDYDGVRAATYLPSLAGIKIECVILYRTKQDHHGIVCILRIGKNIPALL
jgi:hypothetical protein